MASKNKIYNIGIDVGGTKMTSVLTEGGKPITDFTLATPKDNLEHFIIMLKALVDPLLEMAKSDKAKIGTMGIGIPGVMDGTKERILKCPNLSILDGVYLPKILKENFGLLSVMDNDANCFIRAEATLGAGKKYKNVYGITIGTGIGGGWWINDDIYNGSHGGGAEPGHMVVDYKKPLDLEDAYHNLTSSSPAEVARRAYMGDVPAQRIFEELGALFGASLASIVNIIDPEIIIIGGGVVESSDLFLNAAQKTMKELIISPAAKNTKIVKAKLGQLAGAIGASLLK